MLNNFNPHEKLPFECYVCQNTFFSIKKEIRKVLRNTSKHKLLFCSKICKSSLEKKKHSLICKQCGSNFEKSNSHVKQTKNHFCSRSCAATYNNKNKTTGNRRSKLEEYIEVKLTTLYPNIEIQFNCKHIINSELDIYIPSLKLAFELNGIFHYKPIFGQEKYNQIQKNDNNKIQLCLTKGISLCVIDTSSLKYFKEQNANRFFQIINEKIIQSFG